MISKNIKKSRATLIATIVAMIISSASLSFIPLVSDFDIKSNSWLIFAIALAFWMGIFVSLLTAFMTKIFLSRERENLVNKGIIKKKKLPGAFSFKVGLINIIIYSITGIGLVVIVSDIFFGYMTEIIMFPIITLTLISFSLHCVLDGKYYEVYKTIKESAKNDAKY